eukprot:SAG25_NODE_5486_length_653_cov_1.137184_2_plen_22_part_01
MILDLFSLAARSLGTLFPLIVF